MGSGEEGVGPHILTSGRKRGKGSVCGMQSGEPHRSVNRVSSVELPGVQEPPEKSAFKKAHSTFWSAGSRTRFLARLLEGALVLGHSARAPNKSTHPNRGGYKGGQYVTPLPIRSFVDSRFPLRSPKRSLLLEPFFHCVEVRFHRMEPFLHRMERSMEYPVRPCCSQRGYVGWHVAEGMPRFAQRRA